MAKKLKEIPTFANEKEEAIFWQTHDSTDYVDWSQAERMRFTNLKPSTKKKAINIIKWMMKYTFASLYLFL